MSEPLYAITTRYNQALTALLDDDELSLEAITDTLEGLQGEWEDKARAVAAYILNLQASAKQRREAATRILETARREEDRAERLREYLQGHMRQLGCSRLETPEWTARFKRCPPRVAIDDESLIPADFVSVEQIIKIDKGALRAALKEADIQGAHLEQDTKLFIG